MLRIPVEARRVSDHGVWIEVDMGALAHNVRAMRRRLTSGCELIAVVKANAYGHGAVEVAHAVLRAGASSLAVSSIAEGCELRASGISAPILVCGPLAADEAAACLQAGLQPTLSDREQLRACAAAARQPVACHVEIDTGMARHGVAAGDFVDFLAAMRRHGRLRLESVFTHFSGLGAEDRAVMRRQYELFLATLARARDLGPVRRHACNTLASVLLPDAHLDAVRVGGGIYGFDPLGEDRPDLRPVLSLRARCVGLRDLAAGAAVGYGGDHICARASRLALLPLGYGDGLASDCWRGAEVLVRGVRAPIVGRVSMNQIVVDVTGASGVRSGDVFTLIGRDAGEVVRAGQRAPAGGSVYEVTSLLRPGLPRRYLAAPPGDVGRPA